MSSELTPKSDKELWQSLATPPAVALAAVTDMEFAAWLEGRLGEAEAVRIEAAMAADPELRRAALDMAQILGGALPPAPDRMVIRAQALVGFEAERTIVRGGFLSRLFATGSRYALQRAAMATAAIVIAAGGFSVGGGLGESFAQERHSGDTNFTAAVSSSDSSNEISEFFTPDGI